MARRNYPTLIFALFLPAACGMHVSSSGVPRMDIKGSRLELRHITISPDGKYVQVSYGDRSKKTEGGFALLEWRTGALSKAEQSYPWRKNVRPGTHKAAFVKHGLISDSYIALYDKDIDWKLLLKHDVPPENVILAPENGFSSISEIEFISHDAMIFSGFKPINPLLRAQVKALGINPDLNMLPYHFTIGGQPEPITPLIAHQLDANRRVSKPFATSYDAGNASLFVASPSVSADGKRMVFVGLTGTKNAQGLFDYDLFMFENEKISQLTDLSGHFRGAVISADGTTVAFGFDPARTMSWDLHILDLTTMTLYKMDLAKRFELDPAFN